MIDDSRLSVDQTSQDHRPPASRSSTIFNRHHFSIITLKIRVECRAWISMDTTTQRRTPRTPVLGVGDVLGAGDSYLVTNMLPPELADVAFERMKTEVGWKTMHHRGEAALPWNRHHTLCLKFLGGEVPRLVAVEGEVAEDGRCAVILSLFTLLSK